MEKIQIISIGLSLIFLLFVIRLIISGKLREEYSIVWIISTTILVVFSFWRKGLDVVSHIMGIYSPPNLVFTVAIFMIFIYLLHLSLIVSKLQSQNKQMGQEFALLKQKLEKNKDE